MLINNPIKHSTVHRSTKIIKDEGVTGIWKIVFSFLIYILNIWEVFMII